MRKAEVNTSIGLGNTSGQCRFTLHFRIWTHTFLMSPQSSLSVQPWVMLHTDRSSNQLSTLNQSCVFVLFSALFFSFFFFYLCPALAIFFSFSFIFLSFSCSSLSLAWPDSPTFTSLLSHSLFSEPISCTCSSAPQRA